MPQRAQRTGFNYSLKQTFDYKKKITVCCFDCSHVWESTPYTHLTLNPGCPKCRRWKTCDECGYEWNEPGKCPECSSGVHPQSLYEFICAGIQIHRGKYDYKGQITVQCLKCKHNIRTTMTEHLTKDFCCPFCALSFKV